MAIQEEQIPGDMPEMGASKGGGMKQYAVPVLLSGLVVLGMMFGIIPGSAPNYVANSQAMNAKIDENTDSISTMRSAVADATAKSAQAAADVTSARKDIATVQSSVSGFASQSNLNALKQEVDTLKSDTGSGITKAQYDTLVTKIDNLTSQLADANTKIAALQNGTATNGGGTPTTGTVTTSIVTNSNILTSFTTTNSTSVVSYSIPFKIKITNGLNKEIQNLQLYTQLLGYSTSGSFPTGTGSLTSSSGGIWNVYATSGTSWYFTNSNTMSWAGSGLTVPANSTKTITLIFTYKVDPNQNGATIQFTPDVAPVTNGDYDIP